MRQINLLPWRERRLEAMKRTFVMQTVFTVVVVIFIVLAAHKLLTQRLVKQEGVIASWSSISLTSIHKLRRLISFAKGKLSFEIECV